MPWAPPIYNVQGREEVWFQSVSSSHAVFCGCLDPVDHLRRIAARINNAPQQPPANPDNNTLRRLPALPAPPEPPAEQPRRGGDTEEGRGGDGGEDAAGAYGERDLEELFAAAEEDDM